MAQAESKGLELTAIVTRRGSHGRVESVRRSESQHNREVVAKVVRAHAGGRGQVGQ